MKKTFIIASILAVAGVGAYLLNTQMANHGEGHMTSNADAKTEGHGDEHGTAHNEGEMMKVGIPGDSSHISRTIEVAMKETDDGAMIFEPNKFDIKQGETIRFVVKNTGELEHEFVLNDHDELMEHKEMMAKMPEMEHDDPNSVRLIEGTDGEVIWNFTNAGEFEFACLIPGHFEAGMKGNIIVATN